ncbi:translation elongation factor Ts [Gleimia sp. 6138-11-ORH1]|uniref:translation elongation factor Ts n=1 Tax=Gleimia sp. 6138-11-ORH1 TaxID=2973937 RepID=UPI0021685C23|nr:translation elongation factor Ts [Gleimia sp. 6138-11-ORH1]MCS4484135.1 translation elongation factor Ts [Gleimia sp. 6138-11-ORH1]
MANYTAADVKALRDQTGAGMMDVKKALEEANGDKEKALEIIRLSGLKSLAKREDRVASAGLIVGKVIDDKVGIIVEVNSETDFVAKNEKFIAFANTILDAAVETGAADLATLLEAPVEDKKVSDLVDNMGAVIGEKIEIRNVVRVEGDHVALYLHQTSADLPAQVGVLVAGNEKLASLGRDVAMHIAAFSPDFVDSDNVPADVVEKERETLTKLTLSEGKPEHIVPKIVEGRLAAFFQENCLIEQDFAKDLSKKVKEALAEADASVKSFARVQVGA